MVLRRRGDDQNRLDVGEREQVVEVGDAAQPRVLAREGVETRGVLVTQRDDSGGR
jgi:hypothetical protein